jgi:hypothetical protein
MYRTCVEACTLTCISIEYLWESTLLGTLTFACVGVNGEVRGAFLRALTGARSRVEFERAPT